MRRLFAPLPGTEQGLIIRKSSTASSAGIGRTPPTRNATCCAGSGARLIVLRATVTPIQYLTPSTNCLTLSPPAQPGR